MKKQQKNNPLRMQPDYGERQLYSNCLKINDILTDVYKKSCEINNVNELLHNFDYDKMIEWQLEHTKGSKKLKTRGF